MRTEAEHLLYYSIPGFFIFFFVFLFLLIMGNNSFLNTGTIAFVVAAVIPVGYLTYQAYIKFFYDKIWNGRPVQDLSSQLVERILEEKMGLLEDELAKRVKETTSKRHILLFFIHSTQKQDIIDYRWKLINLVNGRGIGMFSSCFGACVPLLYVIWVFSLSPTCDVFTTGIVTLPRVLLRLLLYYAVIVICWIVLSSGIPRIRRILADWDIGIVVSCLENIDKLVLKYLGLNAISEVDKIVSKLEKRDDLQKLVDEAYTCLREERWEESIKKASHAYTLAKQDNGLN